jgi:hypothetical protein
MALTTLEMVKQYLGISTADVDDLLGVLIAQESSAFIDEINRNIEPADYTFTFDGDGTATSKVLEEWPIITVTSVTVDGTAIAAAATVSADGYVFDTDTAQIKLRGSVFTKGTANCVVVYRAGYSPVPGSITGAVTMMVADAYKRRDRIGIMNRSIGGEAITYQVLTRPQVVQNIIDQYARVRV